MYYTTFAETIFAMQRTVYLRAEEGKRIIDEAAKAGVSFSEMIHQIVTFYFKHNKPTKTKSHV